jgi:putative spermidine/putrescine transport system permease protein
MSRFNRAWEEAAYDLGASRWQIIHLVVIPILAPGIVAVALFGFTLSYDEFARTLQTAGSLNTLPLEIWSMTLNVTSPSLYALGTVTTIISFIIIGTCLGTIGVIQKRRAGRAGERSERPARQLHSERAGHSPSSGLVGAPHVRAS